LSISRIIATSCSRTVPSGAAAASPRARPSTSRSIAPICALSSATTATAPVAGSKDLTLPLPDATKSPREVTCSASTSSSMRWAQRTAPVAASTATTSW
jgi:hypothetical protein